MPRKASGETYSVALNLRITPTLATRIADTAERMGVSPTEWARSALSEAADAFRGGG